MKIDAKNYGLAINVLDNEIACFLITYAHTRGWTWGAGATKRDASNTALCFSSFRWHKIIWACEAKMVKNSGYQEATIDDCLGFFSQEQKPYQKLRLTAEYEAEVTTEGIKVGCQNISFDVFDKLAKIVNEVRTV